VQKAPFRRHKEKGGGNGRPFSRTEKNPPPPTPPPPRKKRVKRFLQNNKPEKEREGTANGPRSSVARKKGPLT